MLHPLKNACFGVVLAAFLASSAPAQFGDEPAETIPGGIRFGEKTQTHRLQIGVVITAGSKNCVGLKASVPVPTDWPEQSVKIVDEDVTPSVKRISYRTLGGGAKQMIIIVPRLAAGQVAKALITFEVTKREIIAPASLDHFSIPKSVGREMRLYMTPSPFIESTHKTIKKLGHDTAEGKANAWKIAEALYDVTREKVEYKNGALKGALMALRDGTGDCEEMTSLFVALCRTQKIPARSVWVDGHCYPEFYLVDEKKQGHWFPCQAAGTRSFGAMPEARAILQKGDNFRDPDRPRERLRYVNDHLTGKGGKPRVRFVRQRVEE